MFEVCFVQGLDPRFEDFFVFGTGGAFFAGQEFFVEFFSGAESGVDDFYIPARGQAVKPYEVFGHVVDFYGLAHVEEEYFAPFGLTASLQYELNGFGDGHEEAGHFLVRDGDGAACGNLFFKERYDAAAAAEYVAESHGDEFGLAVLVDFLQHEFCRTLGRAHDASRVYGFVRGDQDKDFRLVFIGQFGYVFRTKYVVSDRLIRLDFHERHMFMRGGMKDDLRMKTFKDSRHAILIRDIRDDRVIGLIREFPPEFLMDFVDAVFAAAEEDDFFSPYAADLAGQFRADASAGAGDQYGFAGNVAGDLVKVQLDRVPAKKVFQADFPQFSHPGFPADHFINARHDADVCPRFAALPVDLTDGIPVRRGDGNHDGVDLVFPDDGGQVPDRTQYGEAGETPFLFLFIIIDKADDRDRCRIVLFQFPCEHGSGISCADDQEVFPSAFGFCDQIEVDFEHQATGSDGSEIQQPGNDHDAARYRDGKQHRKDEHGRLR